MGLRFQTGAGDRTGFGRVYPVTPVAVASTVAGHVACCPAMEAMLGGESVRPNLHRVEVHHGGAGAYDRRDQRRVSLDAYRMGWYPGARLRSVGQAPHQSAGRSQPGLEGGSRELQALGIVSDEGLKDG